MAMNDKRMHFRKSLRADAAIADVLGNTWSYVNFLDLSRDGVAFISAEHHLVGSSRILRFHFPNNAKSITVICKIIYSSAHSFLPGYRVGAKFVRIDIEDMELIDLFINNAVATLA
ncbi:MAG TPA: PilZ domain-containing protein [Burkholderiaceae bacterium]|jgi:hypothetical protein|nr:PilZ domain-containing protein [Burkholderiaceae bacterium]